MKESVFPVVIDEEMLSEVQERYLAQGVNWTQLKKGGVCGGSSLWFIYLYLKTREAFKDPQAHAAALGNLFANRAGKEASLLQLFHLQSRIKYLGLKIDTKNRNVEAPFFEKTNQLASYSLTTDDLQNPDHREKMTEHLNGLSNGAYIILLPGHATACIKTDEYLVLFDPNLGVYFFPNKPSMCGPILHGSLKIFSRYCERTALEKASEKMLEATGDYWSPQQFKELAAKLPGSLTIDFVSLSEDFIQNIAS